MLNPNFHGREGYGNNLTWPKFGKAARLALYMMEMSECLDGGASIKDFIEIQAVRSINTIHRQYSNPSISDEQL